MHPEDNDGDATGICHLSLSIIRQHRYDHLQNVANDQKQIRTDMTLLQRL